MLSHPHWAPLALIVHRFNRNSFVFKLELTLIGMRGDTFTECPTDMETHSNSIFYFLKPLMSKSKTYFEILVKKAFRWHLETKENQIWGIFRLNFKKKCQIPKKKFAPYIVVLKNRKLSSNVFPYRWDALYILVLFGSDFVSWIFIKNLKTFLEVKIDINRVNLTPCQAQFVLEKRH